MSLFHELKMPGFCSLVVDLPDGKKAAVPLKSIKANIVVTDAIAIVDFIQLYKNDS